MGHNKKKQRRRWFSGWRKQEQEVAPANDTSKTYAGIAAPVKPLPPPDPNLTFASEWAQQEYGFLPVVTEQAFHQMTTFLLEETMVEIAGLFHYNPKTNQITWFYRDYDSQGSGGGVHSDSGPGLVAALLAGVGVPAGQWHTHPGFGTYWSGTDLTDQGRVVRNAMKMKPSGEVQFIVANALNWRCRRVVWQDGRVVSRQDGHVLRWDGLKLNFHETPRWEDMTAGEKAAKLAADEERRKQGVAGYAYYGRGYAEWGDDVWDDYPYSPRNGVVRDSGNGPVALLPAVHTRRVGQDAVVWAMPGADYTPLFERFGVAEGEWDLLETEIERAYQGHFITIMKSPDIWADL